METSEVLQTLSRLGLLKGEHLAWLKAVESLETERLAELERSLTAAARPLTAAGDPTATTVSAAEVVVAELERVRAELAGRPALTEAAAALASRIDPQASTSTATSATASTTVRVPPASRIIVPARQRPVAIPQATRAVTAAGEELPDALALAAAFLDRRRSWRGQDSPGREHALVARLEASYPADRRLAQDPISNRALIAAVTSPEAINAAGGLCAPVEVRYEINGIATAARPVRDSLAGFGADRGGVRYIPPPDMGDYAAGVTVWTEANDATPGSDGPSTKPCVSIACPTEVEVRVHAVTRCLTVGNFHERTFPESVAASLEVLVAEHARLAEARLLTGITAGSTAVSSAEELGAARDLLAVVDLVAAGYRSRHRMSDGAMLAAIFPAWAKAMMRTDLARQMPGDGSLAVTDAQLVEYLRVRGIVPTFSLDAQVLRAQAVGVVNDWPDTVNWWLFPPGGWLFLDGGTLDLGLVRDSTLNKTNDAEWFAESFEAVALVAPESLAITSSVCPSGTSGGSATVTCALGS